jgi:mannose-1-phosphate guanylyltransferase
MNVSSRESALTGGDVYAVIMAGGAGTRFWPASRETRPKQLLPLADPAGRESLLAATVRRIAPIVPPERVYVATGTKLVAATARDLPRVPRANLLAEPAPRNTAPCIGWATATIARLNPEALVMVLPSDHFITDEEGFRRVIARALDGARAGYMTTIGVVPTRPETGYGYVELGGAIGADLNAVARFVEKPDRARAEAYVAGGKHLWNAGMFFFRASEMMGAIRSYLPELAAGLAKIDAAAARGEEARELEATFPALPSISIDHGVMEKAASADPAAGGERKTTLAVVPGSFGWNDLGSWESAWELAEKDADGNALPPGAVTVDARGNLVRDLTTGGSGKRVYALVGVSDLVVVETDDAVLVMPRERAQDVKAAVTELKKRGDGDKT